MKQEKSGEHILWHPAFYQVIRGELAPYAESLSFEEEHQLNTEPLRLDLLIVKKDRDLVIDKNIARIFRTDNLVEFKSPKDYLSINDFYKACGYACLYKSITRADIADITLTFVVSVFPRRLAAHLRGCGCAMEEISQGVHIVTGSFVPMQIIDCRRLPDENIFLKSLNSGLTWEWLNSLDLEMKQHSNLNFDTFLQAVFLANVDLMKEGFDMMRVPDVLREKIEEAGWGNEWRLEGRLEGEREGQLKGKLEGKIDVAGNLLKMGLPVETVSKATGLAPEEIERLI
jgi:hypothetical protein